MKKGLLVLAVLALAASAWANLPMIGGTATVEKPQGSQGAFIPTDTMQYHTIFRDGRLYYITHGPNTVLYTATRFTPPYTGTVDSAVIFIWAARAMTPSPTDTLFFYKDTTVGGSQQPTDPLAGYTWSFNPTARGAYSLKLRLGTAFPIQNGVDFWAGYVGMDNPGSSSADSLRTCMDTSITTVGDRQFFAEGGRGLSNWGRVDTVGLTFDWGLSLFANEGSGVELLTPGGPVSLPPRVWASPNPFRGTGEIAFDLPKAARVELTVHDLAGRLVRTLLVGERRAGHHAVRWDGKDALGRPAASGVYLYTLRAGALSATRSLVVIR